MMRTAVAAATAAARADWSSHEGESDPDADPSVPRAIVVVDANVPASGIRAAARLAAAFGDEGLAQRTDAWASGGASEPAACAGAEEQGAAAQEEEEGAAEEEPLAFICECTSVAKCVRAVEAEALHLMSVVKPNRHEVVALANAWRGRMGLPPITAAGPFDDGEGAAPAPAPSESVVDTSVDDVLAGGPSAAAAAAAAAAHRRAQSRGSSPPAAAPADGSPSVVTQRVYVDYKSTPTGQQQTGGEGGDGPEEGGRQRSGRLVGQRGYTVAEAAGAVSSGDPASDSDLTLSVYEEPGAEATVGASAVQEGPADPDASLDYEVLRAAQTVLAAMVRPGVSRTILPLHPVGTYLLAPTVCVVTAGPAGAPGAPRAAARGRRRRPYAHTPPG